MPRRLSRTRWLSLVAFLSTVTVAVAACGEQPPTFPRRPLSSVNVDGVLYTVTSARVMNAADREDRAFLDGRRPARGRTFVGLFVVMCNNARSPRRSSEELRLVAPSGSTASSSEAGDGALAYEPRRLRPGECAPEPLSPPGRAARALVALFELPEEAAPMRPLELEVESAGGTVGRVRVVDVGE